MAIIRRIDALHLAAPFTNSRIIRDVLRDEGVAIGRELVATMIPRMGTEMIYRKPNTPKFALSRTIYPYLLRGPAVERPDCLQAMVIYRYSDGAQVGLSGLWSTGSHAFGELGSQQRNADQPVGPLVLAVNRGWTSISASR